MITLAIDTTGAHCTVAVSDRKSRITEFSENIGRGHAERLAPMVQDALKDAAIMSQLITRIGVCTGPGSFTGLRVGLAFAKSFALPRKLPVIGISALECQAVQSGKNRVLAVMDVRRGDVCWALFDNGDVLGQPITQHIDIAKKDISNRTFDDIVGDGAHLLGLPSVHTHASGKMLIKLAQRRSVNTHPADPLYSRAPDAKLPGGITPK